MMKEEGRIQSFSPVIMVSCYGLLVLSHIVLGIIVETILMHTGSILRLSMGNLWRILLFTATKCGTTLTTAEIYYASPDRKRPEPCALIRSECENRHLFRMMCPLLSMSVNGTKFCRKKRKTELARKRRET